MLSLLKDNKFTFTSTGIGIFVDNIFTTISGSSMFCKLNASSLIASCDEFFISCLLVSTIDVSIALNDLESKVLFSLHLEIFADNAPGISCLAPSPLIVNFSLPYTSAAFCPSGRGIICKISIITPT